MEFARSGLAAADEIVFLNRMAWRLEEHVVRGEIDNRTRDRVTGRIWFAGLDAPVEIELAGNAWRDLAGRRLEFVNPAPQPGDQHLQHIARRQTGVIGDCTASRKVKVPDIPMDQIGEYYAAKKPWPWHWGNSLYFEWFSTANGRVVIESASYELTIAGESTWEMTPGEEEAQRRANAEAMTNFFNRLGEALADEHGRKGELVDDTPPEWNEPPLLKAEDDNTAAAESDDDEFENPLADAKPLSEAEAEELQAESDLLSDRINARVKREGVEHYERILSEELERRRRERGEPPLSPEQEAQRAAWIDSMHRAAQEEAEAPDPELEAELAYEHPLAVRAMEYSVRVMKDADARNWIPADAGEEHAVVDLVSSVMSAAVKLAGALNGEKWPPPADACAHKIVTLKRARGFLDHALLSIEFCVQQQLADAPWLEAVQREVNALAHGCDLLIGELRERLERGFD